MSLNSIYCLSKDSTTKLPLLVRGKVVAFMGIRECYMFVDGGEKE